MVEASYDLTPDQTADFLERVGRDGMAAAVRGVHEDQSLAVSVTVETDTGSDQAASYHVRAWETDDRDGRLDTGTYLRDDGTVTADGAHYLSIVADDPLPDDLEVR